MAQNSDAVTDAIKSLANSLSKSAPTSKSPASDPETSGILDINALSGKAGTKSNSLGAAIANANQRDAQRDAQPTSGRRSRSDRSRSPPARREPFRDNYNPYRDERRNDRSKPTNGRDRSSSPTKEEDGERRDERPLVPHPTASTSDNWPLTVAPPSNSEVIQVESQSVGLIIGRQGENLKRIETTTGAKVQFLVDPDLEATGVRKCRISGDQNQRRRAIDEIFRTAAEDPHRTGVVPNPHAPDASYGAGADAGQPTVQMMVPDRTVGLIIGRAGETIRDLQERSGAHINILGVEHSQNGQRPINLVGPPRTTDTAKALILEVVDSDTRHGPPQQHHTAPQPMPHHYPPPTSPPHGHHTGYQQEHLPYEPIPYGHQPPPPYFDPNARATESIYVPSDTVGMIIGKSGETIKDMQNVTGVKINVSNPEGPDIHRRITLIGPRAGIEDAKRQIYGKVETVREKQNGQLRGDNMPFPSQYSPAPYSASPYGQPYGHPPPNGPSPHSYHAHQAPPPPDAGAYAAYGGYDSYTAMWAGAYPHGHTPSHGHHGPLPPQHSPSHGYGTANTSTATFSASAPLNKSANYRAS